MKTEHPILFSTDMVKAILEGRKTQTRRVNKLEGLDGDSPYYETREGDLVPINDMCPYGQVGDSLWVRETWGSLGWHQGDEIPIHKIGDDDVIYLQEIIEKCPDFQWMGDDEDIEYREDGREKTHWKPSIFLPRKYSRITLEITEIRVQRLQEISPNDCRDEGVEPFLYTINYRKLWDSINGKKYPWESNPWVWAISFKVLVPNQR